MKVSIISMAMDTGRSTSTAGVLPRFNMTSGLDEFVDIEVEHEIATGPRHIVRNPDQQGN